MLRIVLALLLLQGCALFKEKQFHKVVILPETIIHVRNDCDGGMGWASREKNEICVWGYKDSDIVIDYYILGHEIAHKLNHIDIEIRNPDRWPGHIK